MTTWIALLRGVNVGGANKLPMAALRATLEAAGLADVRTYIQSGNVVFRSSARSAARLGARVAEAIEAGHGLRVPVLCLTAEDLRRAVAGSPFDAAGDPKSLHLHFCLEPPADPDLDGLRALATNGEALSLEGRVFYLHAPAGIGRSKCAAAVERHLGVASTARNLRTAQALVALAGD